MKHGRDFLKPVYMIRLRLQFIYGAYRLVYSHCMGMQSGIGQGLGTGSMGAEMFTLVQDRDREQNPLFPIVKHLH